MAIVYSSTLVRISSVVMRILRILTEADEKVLVTHHVRQFLGLPPSLHVGFNAPVPGHSWNYDAATAVADITGVVARRFHALSPTSLHEVLGTRNALEIESLETPTLDYNA
jgi:hypothetical protein